MLPKDDRSQNSHAATLTAHRQEHAHRTEPRGKRTYTARERAEMLCDIGTFTELTPMRTSGEHKVGVVTGWGFIDGRKVTVVSHDAHVASGAIGADMAQAIIRAQRLAIDHRMPIVHLNDSGGARVPDGILALHGCGQIFAHNVESQECIPQISVILGPCAGAAAYSPALTDWTIMVKNQSHMFLTGPSVVRAATGENATAEDIGGSSMHTTISGVAHIEVDNETDALLTVRHLLSFLPSSKGSEQNIRVPMPANPQAEASLADVVPEKASVIFDVRDVLRGVLDDSGQLELMKNHAGSALTVFGRLNGAPVGVVTNQPAVRGGILDAKTSVKIAKFVEFCGRFGIPIITFVDVPGFLPGTIEERRGVITHGAKVLKAYTQAKSPRLTVILRKAYGGAYIAMGSTSLGADAAWAWSNAEIAVMGPEGAVGLLNRRELAESSDPEALQTKLAHEYREQVARPYLAAESGIIESVIHPEETRGVLLSALQLWSQQ